MSFSQNCDYDYSTRKYNTITEFDVYYGTATKFDGAQTSLHMNIFKPIGDENTERPLIVLIHGGGFHAGHRNEMNIIAERYAERGYVAATISYRLGFYSIAYPYTHDRHEIIRAIYRGMQDTRGAIRFLKERHLTDSIDTDKLFLMGGSAGAFIAMTVAYLDKDEEKPEACYQISPVLLGQRPDLGDIQGNLNSNSYSTIPLAVVNIFGAITDTTLIEDNKDPALFSYHQSSDPVVACDYKRPYWGMGLGFQDNYPWVYGSCLIHQRLENLNFPDNQQFKYIYDGNQHDIHDIDLIDSIAAIFLNNILCESIGNITDIPNKKNMQLFPNPANERINFNLDYNDNISKVKLFNANGKFLGEYRFSNGNSEINISNLKPGKYFFRIYINNQIYTESFIKL